MSASLPFPVSPNDSFFSLEIVDPPERYRLPRGGGRASRVQGAALLRTVIRSLLISLRLPLRAALRAVYLRFAPVLPTCHGLGSTPVELRRPRHRGRRNTGFPLLLPGLLPRLYIYGAISTFRRVRSALWPAGFPVYASSKLFRHPFTLPGFGQYVGNAVAPATFNGLANFNATLGSYCWLGFVT